MLRIVHISDLHYPSANEPAARLLADTIVLLKPNVLVVTGDLVDRPSRWIFGKAHWAKVQKWLAGVKREIVEREMKDLNVFVLPGNHDVLFAFGTSGWCWPTRKAFQSVFSAWRAPDVQYFPEGGVTFLTLDTNRWGAIANGAEGRVNHWRLRRLKKLLHKKLVDEQEGEAVRKSTKILLMHNHPLPAPYGGDDVLLHTQRAERLLQFLAEEKIDLVLHGHKHLATRSHIRLGGTTAPPFFIEVLGAGAAMKVSDIDKRGHNFNLIDVAPNGARQIRQFFKPDGEDHFDEAELSQEEEEFGRLIESRFRLAYRVNKISWSLSIDEEGDVGSELTFEKIVFNRALAPYEIGLPRWGVDAGKDLEFQGKIFTPPALGGKLVKTETSRNTSIVFDGQPTGEIPATETVANYSITFAGRPTREMPATATVAKYFLNSHSMDRREAEERGLKDPKRDSIIYDLTDAVEELCFRVDFPSGFVVLNPRLDVLEPLLSSEVVHQRLTGEFGTISTSEPHLLAAIIPFAPPNYRYRLSWDIPLAPQKPAALEAAHARRSLFEHAYLQLAKAPSPDVEAAFLEREEAIIVAFEILFNELDDCVGKRVGAIGSTLDDQAIDLAFMVCDRYSQELPRVKMVRWTRAAESPKFAEFFGEFALEVGEGNAGRAYKTGTVRSFDKQKAGDDPKGHAYKEFSKGPDYKRLLSFPLLDPRSGIPLGVLTAGTDKVQQADLLRALDEPEILQIAVALRGQPLQGLLDAAGLDRNAMMNLKTGEENARRN